MHQIRKIPLFLLPALFAGFAGGAFSQQGTSSARFANGGSAAQIPATFIDQRVFFPVQVNGGQPSLFELDTTARVSSVDPGRAAELNLKSETVLGGSGSSSEQLIRNVVLGLSGVDVPLASLGVNGSANFASTIGREYEGALGADFLAHVVVEIDYGQQSVRLYDPGTFRYQGRGVSIPVTLSGATPVIHAKFSELNGKSGDGEFLVNTALDASVIFSNHFAEAHKLFSSHTTSISVSDPEVDGGVEVSVARIDTFQIGSNTAIGTLGTFSRTDQSSGGDPKIAGTIGGGMLRRYVVVFDYPHQQMIFEPGTEFRTDDEEDKSGMSLTANGPGLKRFEVTQVQPDSPAAKAGVQKGDVIAGVDNEAAADMTLDSVRKLFREAARRYDLLMERNGNTYEIQLQMHRRI